jgi:L-lysine 6-transaminase
MSLPLKHHRHSLPSEVKDILNSLLPPGGQDLVPDLGKSYGCYLYDGLHNREILDLFSFFATKPLGHNHPSLTNDEDYKRNLLVAAMENPTNSDFYTVQLADFARTFKKYAMPAPFKHAFFISGGTLGVENAIKTAMDWKVRKNFAAGDQLEKGHQVIHFREAFHGRSGYTLSLTNSKKVQTEYFSQFNWPRINNPKINFPLDKSEMKRVSEKENEAVEQIKRAIRENPRDICAIIIEPIQSEGGDNHFRKEFFQSLRNICDEEDIMLIFDEVQTGVGLTGKFWAYEHFGIVPDLLAFGKKMQTCGFISTARVDEIEENCFTVKGRLNSTWGGNLADMVHATKILQIIDEEKLVENAAIQGKLILEYLTALQKDFKLTNVRGRGLQCAFDLADNKQRDLLLKSALKNNLLLLGAGEKSIRFRPMLVIQEKEVIEAFRRLSLALDDLGLKK